VVWSTPDNLNSSASFVSFVLFIDLMQVRLPLTQNKTQHSAGVLGSGVATGYCLGGAPDLVLQVGETR